MLSLVIVLFMYKYIFIKYILCCYRNTLSISLLQNLIKEIKKAGSDLSLKSIVICGNGPVFSAGHNLNELVSCFYFINFFFIYLLIKNKTYYITDQN